MPFQKLVEELIPFPDPSYSPLVQVSFALHNTTRDEVAPAGDLRMNFAAVDPGRAPFDLTLRIQETGQGMICSLEYNTDVFERATVTRMLECYQDLSAQVAADAERRLSQLSLEV